jgi:hypothetical protein
LDAFARGTDNALWHRAWNGTIWLPWESLGGAIISAPDASSCSAGSADVFVVGGDGAIWRRSYNGTTTGTWTSLHGSFASGPSAVCQPGTTKIDLFERAADSSLWTQELPS